VGREEEEAGRWKEKKKEREWERFYVVDYFSDTDQVVNIFYIIWNG
jgi:hypothetical protein